MSKFAKGNWRGEFGKVWTDQQSSPIAQVYAINTDEIEATVKLMAAAPDLLEACEEMLRRLQNKPTVDGITTFDMAIKAIAKAKGENKDPRLYLTEQVVDERPFKSES